MFLSNCGYADPRVGSAGAFLPASETNNQEFPQVHLLPRRNIPLRPPPEPFFPFPKFAQSLRVTIHSLFDCFYISPGILELFSYPPFFPDSPHLKDPQQMIRHNRSLYRRYLSGNKSPPLPPQMAGYVIERTAPRPKSCTLPSFYIP